MKSALDPDVYGPPESEFTEELVELEIKDFITVGEVSASLSLSITLG